MDIGLHHLSERFIHELMALQWPKSGKLSRNNANRVVTAAVACTGMPRMEVTIVDDFQFHRREGGLKLLAHAIRARQRAGGHLPLLFATLGGFSDTVSAGSSGSLRASQMDCPTKNANVRPSSTIRCKFTQVVKSKLYSSQIFTQPEAIKNKIQATLSFCQSDFGSGACSPNACSMTVLSLTNRTIRKPSAKSQLATVGFHWI